MAQPKKVWTDEVDMRNKNVDLADPEKFNQIAGQAYACVYNVVHRILHGEQDAREVTQDTFVKAYGAREKFDHRAAPLTWFYKIASNAAFDRIRKNDCRTVSAEVDIDSGEVGITRQAISEPPHYEAIKRDERSQLVRDAIDMLPEHQRMPIYLYYYEDLKVREIAAVLDRDENTVKGQLARGRAALAKSRNLRLASATMEAERPSTLPARGSGMQHAA